MKKCLISLLVFFLMVFIADISLTCTVFSFSSSSQSLARNNSNCVNNYHLNEFPKPTTSLAQMSKPGPQMQPRDVLNTDSSQNSALTVPTDNKTNYSPKNAKEYGAKGDGTTDDYAALQRAIDDGGTIFLPRGTYLISRHLQIKAKRNLSIIGECSNKSDTIIKTMNGYNDNNIIQGWSDSWSNTKGTSFKGDASFKGDVPPRDLSAYINEIDRYINIRNIQFYIGPGCTKEISPIDLVTCQESSFFDGIVFNGAKGVEKGTPIRIRPNLTTGSEISFNGLKISNIVVYSDKWRSELILSSRGSDVDVDNWVTSPSNHKDSPFILGPIDMTMRNIHCEAWSAGKSTFLITSTDFSIMQSFVMIHNQQGHIFEIQNPYADGGYGYSGINITDLRIYPAGDSLANIANKDTLNIIYDTSQVGIFSVALKTDGIYINRIYQANRTILQATDGNNAYLNKNLVK